MRSLLFTFICYALSIGLVAAVHSRSTKPDCVDKCWTNTQYISMCNGDTDCLCSDADFQNAVYQCLYSQCQTAKFGAALHHVIGICADKDRTFVQSSTMMPAILRQNGMRKRQAVQGAQQSVSGSAYMPSSTSRAQSVSASNYMTQSASRASPTPRGSPTARGSPTPRGSPTARGSPTPQGSPAPRVKRAPVAGPKLHRKSGTSNVAMRDFVDNLFRFNFR